ncbi:MAG: magnesium transporter [Acidimicrobiia bacterium]
MAGVSRVRARTGVAARARRVLGLPAAAWGVVGGAVGPDARQSLVALALNSSTSLLAGAVLSSLTDTFERLPGLLVLVPAAIGLRGNIFGSFGNRTSTAIHAGELRFTTRPSSVLGQNVLAAGVLTMVMSALLALIAVGVSKGLGLGETVGIDELALVSIAGGVLASIPVLAATLGLASGAVRYGWDLDNVTAPLVSTLGDVITLPALWVATGLVGFGLLTGGLAGGLVLASVAALVLALRARLALLRRIVRESLPILIVAAVVSTLAGVVLEKRLTAFATLPALLILVPAHLSSAGALGGILSGRLSSKLLLGLVEPAGIPSPAARADLVLVTAVGLPTYALNGAAAHVLAGWLGQASPGLAQMVAASLLGGVLAIAVVLVIAYYGTITAVRAGVDPDSYGIPVVSSSVDLVGALTLVLAIAVLGLH